MVNVSFPRPLTLMSSTFWLETCTGTLTYIVACVGRFLHQTSDDNDAVYNDCVCVTKTYLIAVRCCILIILEIYASRTTVCVWAAGSWTTVYNWHCRQFKPG